MLPVSLRVLVYAPLYAPARLVLKCAQLDQDTEPRRTNLIGLLNSKNCWFMLSTRFELPDQTWFLGIEDAQRRVEGEAQELEAVSRDHVEDVWRYSGHNYSTLFITQYAYLE